MNYVSIVVGDEQSVKKNASKLPPHFTHMNRLYESEKISILRSFDFTGNISVSCLNLDIMTLRDDVTQFFTSRKRSKKRSDSSIVAYSLKTRIENAVRKILLANKYQIEDLQIEVDNDVLREYLRISGLNRLIHPCDRPAHKLADCVVHANLHDIKVDNVTESPTNFREEFHDEVMEQVRRRCE